MRNITENIRKVSLLCKLPKDVMRVCVCVCVCVCFVCVFVLRLLLLPSREGRTLALRSECKIDQADFTDWMSFLPSDLIEEISQDSDVLRAVA